MTEDEFIARFEDRTFPANDFHHPQHIKVVWLYLQRYSLLETLNRFSENLKRFATANGKPNIYHETITWAFVLLINERIARNGRDEKWPGFSSRNADLFDWKNNILKSYYREETLGSDLARKMFILPDKFCVSPT